MAKEEEVHLQEDGVTKFSILEANSQHGEKAQDRERWKIMGKDFVQY
jgi:hypothetical protein